MTQRSRTKFSIGEALFKRVLLSSNGCLEFINNPAASGYGTFYYKGKTVYAHRVAYETFNGKIEDGLCVLHKCDNRICCRPSHLFLGTRTDNAADRDTKHRQPVLENHPMAKMNFNIIEKIKLMRKSGTKQKDVAKEFGLTQQTISCLETGKTWCKNG